MDASGLITRPCGDSRVDLQGESQSDNPPTNNLYRSKVHVDVLGREFSSCDSAYKFYVDYGGKSDFNVRKHHQTKNKMNLVSRVSYCCSKEGYRQKDKRSKVVTYSQPILRVGCRAHMTCLLQKKGKFRVVSFEEGHNHDLIATPMKHMLKINRSMSEAQKAHDDDAEKAGLPIKATVDLMSIKVGGRDNLRFFDKDYWNYIHSKRKTKMKKGDVGAILQYFQKMHLEISSYFYAMQVDDDDMNTNIFWVDAHSVSDYNLFGDVVCFDTTYQTNEYGRPFAPFVGVNHHKQTLVFGAALLYDETTTSFRWLFYTFLSAMSKKQPRTILTDQSATMSRAIFEVFPETCHQLCVWHIYQNAAKNLSHVFYKSTEFAHDFSTCVYDYEDENEWLLAWNNMLEKYSLQDNNWLCDIFNLRKNGLWCMGSILSL